MRAAAPGAPAPIVPVPLDMAHERCDVCGQGAYVMVMTVDGPLAFCAHHFREKAVALAQVSAIIHDIRGQLAPTNRAKG
jgi:hypothetical protein